MNLHWKRVVILTLLAGLTSGCGCCMPRLQSWLRRPFRSRCETSPATVISPTPMTPPAVIEGTPTAPTAPPATTSYRMR
jgi:hypothetical protein